MGDEHTLAEAATPARSPAEAQGGPAAGTPAPGPRQPSAEALPGAAAGAPGGETAPGLGPEEPSPPHPGPHAVPGPPDSGPHAAPGPPDSGPHAAPGPPESGPHAASEAPDLEELSTRAAERDEYLALAQRTRADFENYRKRVARDATAAEARGITRLVRELLPAIDNLQRALSAATAEQADAGTDQLRDGMRLVSDALNGALARVGVESYHPQGERFDPELHEAIAQQEVPGATPGTVAEVYQAGYRLNAIVIRPARVVVAAAAVKPTGPLSPGLEARGA